VIAGRVAVAAMIATATALALGARAEPVPPAGAAATPVFATIAEAWTRGNARALVQHFGTRKVTISLPEGGAAGGQFSREQSYFILEDLFAAASTEEFTFVAIREPREQLATAFGVARRACRPRDRGGVVHDRVFVSLVLEDDRWVVSEIKSVR